MSLRPHWSYNYIGLSGVSCSGLLNLVYREELKVDLVDYGKDVSSLELDEMLALSQGIDTRPWIEISAEMAHEWDVVTFRMRGLDSHLGIIIGRGCMLHVSKEILSRIERFDVEPWLSLSPRFYRYDPKQKQIATSHMGVTSSSPLVLPTLDRVDITCTVPEGSTILEAVLLVFPGITENAFENIRVTIGNHLVSPEYWGRVRPKRWDVVIIRVVPGISGLLRIVLTIAVLVGAAAISGGALGPLAATAGITGGWLGASTVSAALLGAVVGIGGSLLINALFPVRKAQLLSFL
jgi:cell wall-associated NlpC family hydrolase